jgi:uncharacterized OsmC-like protein
VSERKHTGGLGSAEDLLSLKDLYERRARVMTNRPELARTSGHARVRLGGGMEGEPDVGAARARRAPHEPWQPDLAGDDPRAPEQLLRASLAASLAQGYRVWGARLEIPMAGIEVELHTEDDARGQLLIDTDVAPGWQRIHVAVTVVTAAPLPDVQRVINCANRHCLVLATLSRDIEQVHQLQVLSPARAPE